MRKIIDNWLVRRHSHKLIKEKRHFIFCFFSYPLPRWVRFRMFQWRNNIDKSSADTCSEVTPWVIPTSQQTLTPQQRKTNQSSRRCCRVKEKRRSSVNLLQPDLLGTVHIVSTWFSATEVVFANNYGWKTNSSHTTKYKWDCKIIFWFW